MTPHPRLTRAGIELVKRFEGLRRRAARLDNGGWTIGYGHTASAREGAEVTAEQAEMLLIYDLDRVARTIEPLAFAPLNANQFNALVAFAFNIGTDSFRTSSVLKHVNEGAHLQAAAALELWRRASLDGDSLVVDGLVRRRAAEKILFLTPPAGFPPTPTPVVRPAYDAMAADLRSQARGLANAVVVQAPMEGERATAEIAPPDAPPAPAPPAPPLFPEPPPPEPDPHDLAAPPFPVAEAEPPPLPPQPESEPEATPAPPPLAEAAAPPERLFEPPFADSVFGGGQGETADLPIADFGRRPVVEAAPAPQPSNAASSYIVLVVGLVGALMFLGALLAMIYGRATLVNLGIGLVGVVCMVPAALRLLLNLFGERPSIR